MAFQFLPTAIPGVFEIVPQVYGDARGGFAEIFKSSEFRSAGIEASFVQVNFSRSVKGVLRGLHYQRTPKAQAKLMLVASGEIFDVAVDIRPDSPTFKKWVSVQLSSERKNMLWVPAELAHGFQVVSAFAEVMYFVSGSEYAPEAEAGIIWNDKSLNIQWPIQNPILSEKDKQYSSL